MEQRPQVGKPYVRANEHPQVKFLVTATWDDGLVNIEEHALQFAAEGFVKECLRVEGIVKVVIEKMDVQGCIKGISPFTEPDDWDGSQPLT